MTQKYNMLTKIGQPKQIYTDGSMLAKFGELTTPKPTTLGRMLTETENEFSLFTNQLREEFGR